MSCIISIPISKMIKSAQQLVEGNYEIVLLKLMSVTLVRVLLEISFFTFGTDIIKLIKHISGCCRHWSWAFHSTKYDVNCIEGEGSTFWFELRVK